MNLNKLRSSKLMVSLFTVMSLYLITGVAHADRLADVKKAGILHCGVVPGVPGYAFPNKEGKMVGFDVDLCRAVAAAVLGNPDKIKTTKMKLPVAFNAMKAGKHVY